MHNNCKGKILHIRFFLPSKYTFTHNTLKRKYTHVYTHTSCDRKLIPSSSVLNFVNTAWVYCMSNLCCWEVFLFNIFFCPKHVYISNDYYIYKLWHAQWISNEKVCSDQLIESCDWRYLACTMNTWYDKTAFILYQNY